MLEIINFSIGFFFALGCLSLVGITRGHWVSQQTWVILWSIASLLLALFIVISFFLEEILSCVLGGSLGYIVAVTIHTIHHAIEVRKEPKK